MSCCVLHNIRKMIAREHIHEYSEDEINNQIEIGEQALHAEQNWQGARHAFRIQNFLVNDYFH